MANLIELNVKFPHLLISSSTSNGYYEVMGCDQKIRGVKNLEQLDKVKANQDIINQSRLNIWGLSTKIQDICKTELMHWYNVNKHLISKKTKIVIKESRVTDDKYLLIGTEAIEKFCKLDNFLADIAIEQNYNDKNFIPWKVYDYDGSVYRFFLESDYDNWLKQHKKSSPFNIDFDYIGEIFDTEESRKYDLTLIVDEDYLL